jgi:hypothetical protein
MNLDDGLDFDCSGPCAMCDRAADDFARAERGACLLVAFGLPLVWVLAAVREWRAATNPIMQLWEVA